jgi:GDP-mannose 6-dehydrogenase
MKVSVFGLGYVGTVSAGCLARDGHDVIGVDVNHKKAQQVAAGRSPVIEPGLDELISAAVADGRLTATVDGRKAVQRSDISLICVGTPSNGNGSLHLQHVETVCREIGAALAAKSDYHVAVVRSTVLPGTVRDRLLPILEETSGRKVGPDLGLAMNPEFLREGTAVHDYYHASQIVIGELDGRSGGAVDQLFQAVDAPSVRTTIETAEMVKYVSNAFHALKVAFANEIGNLSKAHGVDGRRVMEIFCQDRKLSISPAYLKPGFAFGGSCLPKDVRALVYRAKQRDLECPLLGAVLASNQQQVLRGIELVEHTGCRNVAVLGLSFKGGTDDVRESPVVPLVETLVGRGYRVGVYDEVVDPARLVGANKSFLERELPHAPAEVVVIANGSPAFRRVPQLVRKDQVLIDLAGISNGHRRIRGSYEGICW